MKIFQIVGYYTPFTPTKVYAITEVAYNLSEALVKMGHDVFIAAARGSKSSAKLIPNAPVPLIFYQKKYGDDTMRSVSRLYSAKTLEIIQKNKFDLAHNHWIGLSPLLNLTNKPHLTTLHGGGLSLIERQVQKMFPEIPYVALSKNAIKKSPQFKYIGQVYNGLRLDKFQYNSLPKKHLVWLGRLDPEKGAHLAIKVAEKTKIPLKIGGIIDTPARQKYFNQYIKPALRSKYIEFVGEIARKNRGVFLGQALALLNPIQWEEPFGLVMIEAMACGAPVIAFKRGSAAEIIKNGKTGFLVHQLSEMIQAVKKIDDLRREDCRAWVEERFTQEKMAEEYIKIYQKIIAKK